MYKLLLFTIAICFTTEQKKRNIKEMAKPLGPTGEFFRRRDEWRKHPRLTNQLRHATPGLGFGLVAFGIYLVGEQVYNKLYAPSSSSSHSSASHWGDSSISFLLSAKTFFLLLHLVLWVCFDFLLCANLVLEIIYFID